MAMAAYTYMSSQIAQSPPEAPETEHACWYCGCVPSEDYTAPSTALEGGEVIWYYVKNNGELICHVHKYCWKKAESEFGSLLYKLILEPTD